MAPFAQRFAEAVQTLIGDGPVKQRLATRLRRCTWKSSTEADLPPVLRRDFGELAGGAHPGRAGRQRDPGPCERAEDVAEEARGHAGTILKLYVALLDRRSSAGSR